MTTIPLICYAEGPLTVGQTIYAYTSSVALNLVSFRTLLRSGTSFSLDVRKNGVLLDVLEVTGLDSGTVTIPNLFFADTDVLTILVTAAVDSPTDLTLLFNCTVEDAVDQSADYQARRIQTPLVARYEGDLVANDIFFKFVAAQQIGIFRYTISLRVAADADVVVDLLKSSVVIGTATLPAGSLTAAGLLAAYYSTAEELTLRISQTGGALPGSSLQLLLDYRNIQQTTFSAFQTPLIVECEAPTYVLAALDLNAAGTTMVPGTTTLTLVGGTYTTAAQLLVTRTKVVSVTLLTNGSGGPVGIPALAPISGTTGSGTKVTFQGGFPGNGTLTSVSLTGFGANGGGSYTTNPTNLASEPLSGTWTVRPTVSLVMGVETFSISVPGLYTAPPTTFTSTGGGNNATFQNATYTPSTMLRYSVPRTMTVAVAQLFSRATTSVAVQVGFYRNSVLLTVFTLASGATQNTPIALDFVFAESDILEARVISGTVSAGLLLTLDYYIEVGVQAAEFLYYADPDQDIIILARQVGFGGAKADAIPLANLEKYKADVQNILDGRLRALYRTPLCQVARGNNPWPGAIQSIAQRLVLQRLLNDIYTEVEPNASTNVAANAQLANDDLQQILDRMVLLEGQRLRSKNYGSSAYTEPLGVNTIQPTSPPR